ncbi:MAG: glycosyltransferase family 4 protein [Chloroflexi bacterium]|nr:glycosyltransferase family 4 protein [Chloroflexota bacterium]
MHAGERWPGAAGVSLRMAFVLEQTLGHVTHTRNLRAAAASRPGLTPVWLPIPFDVRGAGRFVPLYRGNWSVRASWRARQALHAARAIAPLDALFFHTQVTSLFSVDLMRRVPTIVSLDATPINYDSVGASYGHQAAGDGLLDRQKFRLNRRALHAARALVTWSAWAKRSLVEDYGVPAERIHVLAPGAAEAFFALGRRRIAAAMDADDGPADNTATEGGSAPLPGAPAEMRGGRPIRLLFVGGDWERKGGPDLLAALDGLTDLPWRLDVVTRAELPAHPGVVVHRAGPNSPELLELFARADLFVLPSHGECLAVVLMEATAAGLPVVTTDVGALGEAVLPGESGVLLPPNDVGALREALRGLLSDAGRRSRMGRAGHALAIERFDAYRNGQTLFDLLAEHARLGASSGRAA